jgi:hypothetical protein
MNLRHISHSAVRQLQLELDPYEEQAKEEIRSPQTHSLGMLRMDLVTECRRRLMFFSFMVRDKENHPRERRRRSPGATQ